MNQGRSIRLFLVDGTPGGLLTAEIMNWTGHVLAGPRAKLSELVQRPEVARTGVYFLVGPDPDNSLRPLVYIGETDDVGKRLKQHNRPEDQGGKDFWEKVVLVTSKDQNLTKSHVKHLESVLLASTKASQRCNLINGTAHDYVSLPESDLADMAFFAEQIRTILPVLGHDFLREQSKPVPTVSRTQSAPDASPIFVMTLPKHGISARAQEVDGEFIVLAGSQARNQWTSSPTHGYANLHKQLQVDGILAVREDGKTGFTRDHAFSSPSAAAAMVAGRAANGRTEWRLEVGGQTYADWQDQQVNASLEAFFSEV